MAFKTIVPSEFPKPPTGTYVASVQAIWDLGTKTGKFGNDERQFVLNFELDALTTEGQPYTIIQFINPIICNTRAGKSRFWSILEELFGRTLTKTEAAELCPEPKTLLGRPCVLKVQYDADRGRSAIMGIAPLLKGQRAPVPVSGLEYLELSKEEFDDRIFSSLSKYFQTMIRQSREYHDLYKVGLVVETPLEPETSSGHKFSDAPERPQGEPERYGPYFTHS